MKIQKDPVGRIEADLPFLLTIVEFFSGFCDILEKRMAGGRNILPVGESGKINMSKKLRNTVKNANFKKYFVDACTLYTNIIAL